MTTRRITTVGGGPERTLDQELDKFFVTELVAPSNPLWIVSAWLSDVELVDNRGGELHSLAPGFPVRRLRLLELLEAITSFGGSVRVVVRDERHNRPIVNRLQDLRHRLPPGGLQVMVRPELHDKVILSERMLIEGSMNLTHRGRLVNEEGIRFTSDADQIERQRLDFEDRFGGG